jgi:hypothetical protein
MHDIFCAGCCPLVGPVEWNTSFCDNVSFSPLVSTLFLYLAFFSCADGLGHFSLPYPHLFCWFLEFQEEVNNNIFETRHKSFCSGNAFIGQWRFVS